MCTRINVVDSEKSPKLTMANWSLDLINSKEVQRITRSERTVTNKITMEQKILHRRYKQKLTQSKMALARIKGDRDTVNSLREKTTFVLNTNIGHDDEDGMLRKIWDTTRKSKNNEGPLFADGNQMRSLRTKSAPVPRSRIHHSGNPLRSKTARPSARPAITTTSTAKTSTTINTHKDGSINYSDRSVHTPRASVYLTNAFTDDVEPVRQSVENGHLSPHLSPLRNTKSTKSHESMSVPAVHLKVRPSTAVEGIRESRESFSEKESDIPSIRIDTDSPTPRSRPKSAGPRTSVVEPPLVNTDSNYVDETDTSETVHEVQCTSGHVKNESEFLKTVNDMLDDKPHDKQAHKSPKQSTVTVVDKESTSRPQTASKTFKMFVKELLEMDNPPSLFMIQQVRENLANYEGRVSEFAEKIKPLKAPEGSVTDYYTSRLMESSKKGRNTKSLHIPDAPYEVYKRAAGNVEIRNMTIRPLSYDFGSQKRY